MTRLTLTDLLQLCEQYVPISSRHPGSIAEGEASWWYAHELGHLLTVKREQIGQPMFGLEWDSETSYSAAELRCRELAAMDVSRRLLNAARRADLAREEIEETAIGTIAYGVTKRGEQRVRRILADHGVCRLPRDRAGLELVIRRAVGA